MFVIVGIGSLFLLPLGLFRILRLVQVSLCVLSFMFLLVLRCVCVMICRTIAGQYVQISSPAILAFVADLGLVPGQRPLFFCERWKIERERQMILNRNLCRELAKRNRKYSRYVYASLVDSPKRPFKR